MAQKSFFKIPYKYIFLALWSIVILGFIVVMSLFMYVAKTKMPNTDELENPTFEQATLIYSSDGKEIDRYFSKNREWIQYEDLSPYLIDALVATEDHRYFSHSGIDSYSLMRAAILLGRRGGASTITQQLAKQFFTDQRSSNPIRRIWQKMKEWVIAVEFERRYTKEEILAMFYNKFDFYYSANGVAAASQVYFGKDQKDLTINEAAMFVGMFKNPYYFNPIREPERAAIRRKTVLAQMRKREYITEEEYAEARAEELDMSKFRRKEVYNGLAPHFMSELKKHVRTLMAENNITKPGGESYDLDNDGLRIYTTIDSRYQKHAEAAAEKHMTALQRQFENTWSGKDLWEHIEEGHENLKSRNSILNNQVENSQRYATLRKKYLGEISNTISTNIDNVRLWNADIIRMYRADQDDNYFTELIGRESISRKQRDVYEEIMSSEYWPKLKRSWIDLGKAAKKAFNTKEKLTIPTYNGTVQRVMTPMDSIKHMLNHLQIGSVAMDPKTGYVKSWVGGVDYTHWKYDHVNSNRQAGSTFKPFLYTTAVMNGYSPCYPVEDIQYTIPANERNFSLDKSWSPKNARGTFSNERVTLKEALKKSLNSVSLWLVREIGSVDGIIQLAENMGISSGKIPRYPSIILGTPNVSVLEMTTAYSTFANNGERVEPIFIEKITDRHGVEIYRSEVSSHRSIPEDYNYVMVDMLKYAAGAVSWKIKSDCGGKTGTTNDHVDAWFMGVTPNLVTGTWVGGEYPWIRFTNFNYGQGSYMARPFFLDFMTRVESDKAIGIDTEAEFNYPDHVDVELDCSKYAPFLNPDPDDDPNGDPEEPDY